MVSLKERPPGLTWRADATAPPPELASALRMRAAASAARQLAVFAMRATAGNVPPDERADGPPADSTLAGLERVTLEHATVRSVWLQNSVRGAVALAIAVFIAQ